MNETIKPVIPNNMGTIRDSLSSLMFFDRVFISISHSSGE
jgi:hypothetical protein